MYIESIERVFRKGDGAIIDVREPFEYRAYHLQNSKNIPKNELLSNADYLLDRNEKYYLICQSGNRSLEVTEVLHDAGYKVFSIDGGIELYDRIRKEKSGVIIGNQELQLRYATLEDVKVINSWWNNGAIMKDVGYFEGLEQSVLDTEKELINKFVSNQQHQFLIEILETEQAIGECHYKVISKDKVEIGLKIGELDYQQQGYGKKAMQLLLEHLFSNEEINIICLNVLKENEKAKNLYASLGFQVIQTYKNFWRDSQNNERDVHYLELNRRRYFDQKN